MKLGFLSDAHGNEPGFNQCLAYLEARTDRFFFLGDAVGYFPVSNALIDRLRQKQVGSLKGNHDAMLLGELPYDEKKDPVLQLRSARREISEKNLDFLRTLSPQMEITAGNRKLLLLHGGPDDPLSQYVFPDTDLSEFAELEYDAVIMGHTHRAFQKKINNRLFVNAGSCGFSRDNGNKITVAVYDTVQHEAEIVEFRQEPEAIIRQYGNRLHPSVMEILTRNPRTYGSA